jgi:hypothetical protein
MGELAPEVHGFSECDPATDADPIRQGDVFRWLGDDDPVWKRYGIVVTADCDIAFDKHAGVLSYVPVLRAEHYLSLAFLPDQVQRVRDLIADEIRTLARRLKETHQPGYAGDLTDRGIDDAVRTEEAPYMADALNVPVGPDRQQLTGLIEAHQRCDAAAGAMNYSVYRDAIEIAALSRGLDAEKAVRRLASDTTNRLERPPGDVFFVGSVHEAREGFVAYLRLVREINQTEIAITTPQVRVGDAKAIRVARLRSPYVYRLTQQLGDVFSAIGLPTTYEANRRDHATRITGA